MLRRSEAAAVVAARRTIVDGAVGMVENALENAGREEGHRSGRGAQGGHGSNLLVRLCSEQSTQPVVNAGSLYH
jgi:hypothetical protein